MCPLPISGVGASPWVNPVGGGAASRGAGQGGASFADTLQNALNEVDQSQHHADDKLAELASGKSPDIHGTMIALQEADITLRTMVSVRDKVVDAYQQIMNMQI
ncbi:MAG: flagellar hook-basal body complex protein FliE [Pseudomonadota bacterium]